MDGKRIRPGAQMLATHDYKKNPQSPVGNELDVNEGDTLVCLMTNNDNEHWWLAEDGTGGLCASDLSEYHQRCDPPGRGK